MTAEGPLASTLDYFKQGCEYINTTSSSVKTQEQEGSKRGRGTGGGGGGRVENKEGGKD